MPHRRTVLKAVAGASLMTAASLGRVLGANDRVRVGLIGHGLIGTRHLLDFKAQPDVEIVGVSELSDARLEAAAAAAGNGPARYKDFRKLLDRQDLDAVVVSTPDHWHALMTILACAAGKDVYVEKPLTHVLREGEWMQQAAAAHKRRGAGRDAAALGPPLRALRGARARRAHRRGPQRAHVGVPQHPARLLEAGRRAARRAADWDMWLGPAPFVPFDPRPLPLPLPLVLGLLGRPDHQPAGAPHRHRAVDDGRAAAAGRRPWAPATRSRESARRPTCSRRSSSTRASSPPGRAASWPRPARTGSCSTARKGTLTLSRAGFEVVPGARDLARGPDPALQRAAARPGGATLRTTPLKEEGFEQVRDQFVPHVRNFVDCVKSRATPVSDLASSHRSSVPCHLANISMKLGRTLQLGRAEAGRRRRPRGVAGSSPRNTAAPGTASCARRFPVREPRRGFLRVLGAGGARRSRPGRAWRCGAERALRDRLHVVRRPPAARARPDPRRRARRPARRGASSTSAVPSAPTAASSTCRSSPPPRPHYLDGLKRKLGEAGLFVELVGRPARSSRTRALRGRGPRWRAGSGPRGCAWPCSTAGATRTSGRSRRGVSSPTTGGETLPRAKARARSTPARRWGSRTTRTGAPTSSSS